MQFSRLPYIFHGFVFSGLLTVDPSKRLSLEDLRRNEWITGDKVFSVTPLETPSILNFNKAQMNKVQSQLKSTMNAFHQATREGFRLRDVSKAKLAERRRKGKVKRGSNETRSSSSSDSAASQGSSTPSQSPARQETIPKVQISSQDSQTKQENPFLELKDVEKLQKALTDSPMKYINLDGSVRESPAHDSPIPHSSLLYTPPQCISPASSHSSTTSQGFLPLKHFTNIPPDRIDSPNMFGFCEIPLSDSESRKNSTASNTNPDFSPAAFIDVESDSPRGVKRKAGSLEDTYSDDDDDDDDCRIIENPVEQSPVRNVTTETNNNTGAIKKKRTSTIVID